MNWNWYLVAAAALHTLFMLCELFPWGTPLILRSASKKECARLTDKERAELSEEERDRVSRGELFAKYQKRLVATIVHNAGIYNGIVAAGLFWAVHAGPPAADGTRVLLIGAVVAGLFGAVTLKAP